MGAPRQTGKDYELWLMSDKLPGPRSFGVVGEQEFTVWRDLPDYDAPMLSAASYAVSLEPSGGSPTGAPTGPVMFTGKLMQTTPPAFPGPTP
jgi:anti-sigma-K factor RskA